MMRDVGECESGGDRTCAGADKCERGVLIWRRGNCGFERIHDGRTFAVGRDHV